MAGVVHSRWDVRSWKVEDGCYNSTAQANWLPVKHEDLLAESRRAHVVEFLHSGYSTPLQNG